MKLVLLAKPLYDQCDIVQMIMVFFTLSCAYMYVLCTTPLLSSVICRLDAEAKGSKVLVTLTERGREEERKKHR